jgi:hypothetical protein
VRDLCAASPNTRLTTNNYSLGEGMKVIKKPVACFALHNWKIEDAHLVGGRTVEVHGGGDKGADSLWI